MKRQVLRTALTAASALAAWGLAPSAWAGVSPGTIGYGPLAAATSVPTLGEWSLLLLALLVMAVAYRALRGRVNSRLLTHLLLGGGLAAGGLASGHWVQSVQAVVPEPEPEVTMTTASGGTVDVSVIGAPVMVTNGTAVSQQIKALTTNVPGVSWVAPDSGSPQCQVGTVVAADASCYVQLAGGPG